MLSGGSEEREAYLRLLSSGSSHAPIDIFRNAGVDPSQPSLFEAAAHLMEKTLTDMEEILAREM